MLKRFSFLYSGARVVFASWALLSVGKMPKRRPLQSVWIIAVLSTSLFCHSAAAASTASFSSDFFWLTSSGFARSPNSNPHPLPNRHNSLYGTNTRDWTNLSIVYILDIISWHHELTGSIKSSSDRVEECVLRRQKSLSSRHDERRGGVRRMKEGLIFNLVTFFSEDNLKERESRVSGYHYKLRHRGRIVVFNLCMFVDWSF
jgi:hypothetical protein